jgi:RimJ/RimL family protein N-acetyltransferase
VTGRDGASRFLILTARLRLRSVSVEDLDSLYRVWTDPVVRRFIWDGEVILKERAEVAVGVLYGIDRRTGDVGSRLRWPPRCSATASRRQAWSA